MSIAAVVRHTAKFVDQVVVVDDHSTDRTFMSAVKAGAIVIQNGFGKQAHLATLYGIKSVDCDIIVNLDADGQQPPNQIPKLLKPILDADADCVVGRRGRLPPSERPVRAMVKNILGAEGEMDAGSGFRAFRRLKLSKAQPKDLGFCGCGSFILFAHRSGARIVEVPYRSHARKFGGSKIARKSKYLIHRRQASFLRNRYGIGNEMNIKVS